VVPDPARRFALPLHRRYLNYTLGFGMRCFKGTRDNSHWVVSHLLVVEGGAISVVLRSERDWDRESREGNTRVLAPLTPKSKGPLFIRRQESFIPFRGPTADWTLQLAMHVTSRVL
jgi:hypothetical protein